MGQLPIRDHLRRYRFNLRSVRGRNARQRARHFTHLHFLFPPAERAVRCACCRQSARCISARHLTISPRTRPSLPRQAYDFDGLEKQGPCLCVWAFVVGSRKSRPIPQDCPATSSPEIGGTFHTPTAGRWRNRHAATCWRPHPAHCDAHANLPSVRFAGLRHQAT